MAIICISKTIHAPVHEVFQTVADIREFSKATPSIVKVEFLSDIQSGVGTRYRETRLLNETETQTTLEIAEYIQDERVRMVAIDSQGNIWDTVFTVQSDQGNTLLTMTMESHPKTWVMKLLLWLAGNVIRLAVESNLDKVKAYCERWGKPTQE